jgi:hypothetical protein
MVYVGADAMAKAFSRGNGAASFPTRPKGPVVEAAQLAMPSMPVRSR